MSMASGNSMLFSCHTSLPPPSSSCPSAACWINISGITIRRISIINASCSISSKSWVLTTAALYHKVAQTCSITDTKVSITYASMVSVNCNQAVSTERNLTIVILAKWQLPFVNKARNLSLRRACDIIPWPGFDSLPCYPLYRWTFHPVAQVHLFSLPHWYVGFLSIRHSTLWTLSSIPDAAIPDGIFVLCPRWC